MERVKIKKLRTISHANDFILTVEVENFFDTTESEICHSYKKLGYQFLVEDLTIEKIQLQKLLTEHFLVKNTEYINNVNDKIVGDFKRYVHNYYNYNIYNKLKDFKDSIKSEHIKINVSIIAQFFNREDNFNIKLYDTDELVIFEIFL